MCRFLQGYKEEIMNYCQKNGLSSDKVFSAAWCGNNKVVFLQYVDLDSERAQLGLLDDRPAPITLKIFLEDGKLRFEQTDITRKYLGADCDVAAAPKVSRSVRPSVRSRRELAYA